MTRTRRAARAGWARHAAKAAWPVLLAAAALAGCGGEDMHLLREQSRSAAVAGPHERGTAAPAVALDAESYRARLTSEVDGFERALEQDWADLAAGDATRAEARDVADRMRAFSETLASFAPPRLEDQHIVLVEYTAEAADEMDKTIAGGEFGVDELGAAMGDDERFSEAFDRLGDEFGFTATCAEYDDELGECVGGVDERGDAGEDAGTGDEDDGDDEDSRPRGELKPARPMLLVEDGSRFSAHDLAGAAATPGDGHAAERHTVYELDVPATDGDAVLSPDGTTWAYERETGGGDSTELWTIRTDGSEHRRVVEGGSPIYPTWSPDGTQVAFMRDGLDGRRLGIAEAKDEQDPRLTRFDDFDGPAPVWSPDGRHIAGLGVDKKTGDLQVAIVDAGSLEVSLHGRDVENTGISFTPDGRRVAFVASVPLGTASEVAAAEAADELVESALQVMLLDVSTGRITQLTRNRPYATYEAMEPRVSPDGAQIAFLCAREIPGDVNIDGPIDLCTVPTAGGRATVHATGDPSITEHTWSPDGHLAYVNEDEDGTATVAATRSGDHGLTGASGGELLLPGGDACCSLAWQDVAVPAGDQGRTT